MVVTNPKVMSTLDMQILILKTSLKVRPIEVSKTSTTCSQKLQLKNEILFEISISKIIVNQEIHIQFEQQFTFLPNEVVFNDYDPLVSLPCGTSTVGMLSLMIYPQLSLNASQLLFKLGSVFCKF